MSGKLYARPLTYYVSKNKKSSNMFHADILPNMQYTLGSYQHPASCMHTDHINDINLCGQCAYSNKQI